MTPEDAFLADIIEHPDDDTPRLVYADWHEDHGQPERAEFVRVQITLASLPPDDPRRPALKAREGELLARHEADWRGQVGPGLVHRVYRRGFVEALRIQAQTFVMCFGDLHRLGPIRQLSLVGVQPYLASLLQSPGLLRSDAGKQLTETRVALSLFCSPKLAGLTHLDLAGNDLGDRQTVVVAASPSLAGLRGLGLADNQIGEEGLQALANAPYLGQLVSLDLSGNPIDPGGPGMRALRERFGDRVHLA
jgi:uncharacterized protein (TIGR02996 family)